MSSTTVDFRRHAPVGRGRRAPVRGEASGLALLYASSKRRALPDLFITDRAEARRGGGFRWFFSTCLAAGVGAVAIAAVIFGNMDTGSGFIETLDRTLREGRAQRPSRVAVEQGLAWSAPKSDRLQETTGAAITKYIVQESISQRRGNREYIHRKPYARIVVRLAAVPAAEAAQLPRFDPMRLLAGGPAGPEGEAEREGGGKPSGGEVVTRIVELSGALLPSEDGQEMDAQEAAELVRRAMGTGTEEAVIRSSFLPEGADAVNQIERGLRQARASQSLAANTSVIEKTSTESDEIDDDSDSDSRRIKVKAGRSEGLEEFLRRHGADRGLARSMVDAAKGARAVATLTPDLDIELGLLPSLTQPDKLEPVRVTITSGAGEHRLTIARNSAGEFFASTTPVEVDSRGQASRGGAGSTLYASLYHSAMGQGIPAETIEQILRVHAPETDFRRRARGSDGLELFFDLKDEDKGADSAPSDLLYTAITVDGDVRRYYRFRTPDGGVDYYDPSGANSRRFLMRRPARSDEVKFNNGFGMRPHPILGGLRMHTGVDYSGPMNTPIVAAGSGVIEEVRFKVNNGNYIRIRHANGYQTAYSHLSRFAAGAREGGKVTQGQVIGYLGNTGLSTGPHLHFEVLIGNRFVDPMTLPDQREKRLAGKQLADFNRERARIEDLMRRPPVRVARMDGR